jgi:hypothetical protein
VAQKNQKPTMRGIIAQRMVFAHISTVVRIATAIRSWTSVGARREDAASPCTPAHHPDMPYELSWVHEQRAG